MKTDIINTDYLYDNRIHKTWKNLILFYGISLIFLTTLNGFEILNQYENYENIISILSKIFLGFGILLFFLNLFLFSRIGRVEIEKNLLNIKLDGAEKTIDLNSINQVVFGKDSNNFFYLKIAESELIIELDKSQLLDFKSTLENFDINIKHRHLSDRMANWLSKK